MAAQAAPDGTRLSSSFLEVRARGQGVWSLASPQPEMDSSSQPPLAFEPSPKEAQTFKPIGGSLPKGFYRNLLTFRRRFGALKKWLRL